MQMKGLDGWMVWGIKAGVLAESCRRQGIRTFCKCLHHTHAHIHTIWRSRVEN